MSQFIVKLNTNIRNKIKLISKSYKNRKISNINNYTINNYSLFNISSKENKTTPYKINYTKNKTETTFSINDINPNLKTEPNFKRLNEMQLDNPNLKIMQNNKALKTENNLNNINKYRIFSANMVKNQKRISFLNQDNNYRKEAKIYLNSFIEKLEDDNDDNKNKRLLSSKGFIRKAEYDTEKVLKNKNKRQNISYGNSYHNPIKNLDLDFHNNNYKYSYVSTDKNKTLFQKDLNYETIVNHKKENNKNIQNNLTNKTDKENYFRTIINNITRKVQFLNSKNIILSNENTMNLLNKEEYFLYKQLNEFFKDNCSIKKFSKSIFDTKNGNKYLLPLFNEMNFNYSNPEDKNKKEISKLDYEFNIFKELLNNPNEYTKKNIIEIFLNKQFKKQRKNNFRNNLFFKSNIDDEKKQMPNQRIIELNKTLERNNFENPKKINNNNYNKIVMLKNHKKNKLKGKNKNRLNIMKIIEHNENIVNNYHKTINYSTNVISYEKPLYEYKKRNKTIPIKFINHQKNEIKSIRRKEKTFSNRNNDYRVNSRINPIFNSKQSTNNEEFKLNKNNEKKKNSHNINKKYTRNNIRINKYENIEENKNEPIRKIARLTTKNFHAKSSSKNINKTANNEDIKNLLLKGNNFYSEFAKKYSYNSNATSSSRNNVGLISNENTSNSNVATERKNNLQNISKKSSKSVLKNKNEENNINSELNKITISNNLILKESIENEENKLIEKIEMKKNVTMKLLYSFLKAHIRDIINKEQIKELLTNPEFKKNIDLLKHQINQLNDLSKDDSKSQKRKSKILKDEDIIDILYEEVNKKNPKKAKKSIKKSSYIPVLHLKKRLSQRKKTEIKEEEKKTETPNSIILQKENEKLELMATEITLVNELRNHIRQTFNKEFKERLQSILDKIESYQNLDTDDHFDTFKKNYSMLKEEMDQILRDKEREERINSFMNHLDSDRNIFETKWNFCNNKINVVDNKVQTSFGINRKINYK